MKNIEERACGFIPVVRRLPGRRRHRRDSLSAAHRLSFSLSVDLLKAKEDKFSRERESGSIGRILKTNQKWEHGSSVSLPNQKKEDI